MYNIISRARESKSLFKDLYRNNNHLHKINTFTYSGRTFIELSPAHWNLSGELTRMFTEIIGHTLRLECICNYFVTKY